MRLLRVLLFFSICSLASQCFAGCLLGPNHGDNSMVLFTKLSKSTHFERIAYNQNEEDSEVGTIDQMGGTTTVKLLKLSTPKGHDQIHIFTTDLSEKTYGFYQFIDLVRHDPEPIVGRFNEESCSVRFEEKDTAVLDIEVKESGVLVTLRDRDTPDQPYKKSARVHYRIGDGKS